MKKLASVLSFSALLAVPAVAAAQFGEINDFLNDISSFIGDVLIPLLFGVALLLFLWGVVKFFIMGSEDDRKEGKQYMIWAVIGFVVMVSIFGIVNLVANGLGFSDDEELDNIPNVPTTNR